MPEENLKKKTVKGTFWSSVERFSVQAIQFVVMIFMARILTPADYGIVGMLAVFLAVSQSLIDSGFSQALIRKQNRTQLDNSTVFYFNIIVGLTMYFTLFFCAHPIARFYDQPILIPITRIMAISLPLNSLAVVQRAILTINLNFKTQAAASLASAVVTGIVGLSLAYTGYGVWAIVWASLAGTFVNVLVLFFIAHWRPSWEYSWDSFREMFRFGSKLLASGLLNTVYVNIYPIVIGKIFKAADLGFYTRAYNFANLPSSNLTGIFQRVSFPVLCTIQDDDQRLTDVYRRMLRVSAFIIFPLMTGLAAVAEPLIVSILTDKWLYSAVLLVPICLNFMWYPIHAINLNLLQVKGRSDLFLKLEIWKKLLGVAVLIGSIPLGLYWMCWGGVISSLIALVINTYYTGVLIQLGFFRQMRDLLPTLILSLAMGVGVWALVSFVPMPSGGALAAGVGAGLVFYIGVAKLLRFSEFSEVLSLIPQRVRNKIPLLSPSSI
ncbi:MAG: lipopolysaccharide biosynthesis protein [Muribaculaceae bacterium]|nr:lipopolysaccharide biosynthesis protein [Muribaculaceae bacterium]